MDYISTTLSIPIAAAGFYIAIKQINKTKVAAEAARDAAETARKQVGRGSLLVLLPQLQRTEEELERAINLDSRDLCATWLNTWRWQAGQLKGHLRRITTDTATLETTIQASVVASANAKNNLMGPEPGDLKKSTSTARRSIAAVTSEIGDLLADNITTGLEDSK